MVSEWASEIKERSSERTSHLDKFPGVDFRLGGGPANEGVKVSVRLDQVQEALDRAGALVVERASRQEDQAMVGECGIEDVEEVVVVLDVGAEDLGREDHVELLAAQGGQAGLEIAGAELAQALGDDVAANGRLHIRSYGLLVPGVERDLGGARVHGEDRGQAGGEADFQDGLSDQQFRVLLDHDHVVDGLTEVLDAAPRIIAHGLDLVGITTRSKRRLIIAANVHIQRGHVANGARAVQTQLIVGQVTVDGLDLFDDDHFGRRVGKRSG